MNSFKQVSSKHPNTSRVEREQKTNDKGRESRRLYFLPAFIFSYRSSSKQIMEKAEIDRNLKGNNKMMRDKNVVIIDSSNKKTFISTSSTSMSRQRMSALDTFAIQLL
ncbi:CLUMA_CG018549, isoform A [Clunio marinus]|uniref:CLUMA_CG018549, isoform A n=1 Tax=Clunio marinus TaxID=568069 RepID=A0A1J1IZ94_9DIPT|nr:CLUMA_CG018549, isoform A [Clunio marinus]